MTVIKMHDQEVSSRPALVQQLLLEQFPQWAQLPIRRVKSAGTDHAIYRLGRDMMVRLPRIEWATDQIDKEFAWLPRLAPDLPLAVPQPVVKGKPSQDYPYDWAIYRWIDGENATIDAISDPCLAAADLARFIRVLQQLDTLNAPPAAQYSRGVSLHVRDRATRAAIAALGASIAADQAIAIWEAALAAAEWVANPVWYHGDLLVGNLLFDAGRLKAVIDFGGLAVGDPTCDLMIAWSLFSGESRNVFRAQLNVNEAQWVRGRGHALSQAVIFIPYYLNTNPVGVRYAQRMLDEIFADFRANG